MLRRKDKSPLKADGRAQSEDGDGEAKTRRRDGETRNRGSVEWVLRGNYFGRRSEEVEGASRSKSVCAELPCFRFSCQALSVTTSSVQASRLWNSSTASGRATDRYNDFVVCIASSGG